MHVLVKEKHVFVSEIHVLVKENHVLDYELHVLVKEKHVFESEMHVLKSKTKHVFKFGFIFTAAFIHPFFW